MHAQTASAIHQLSKFRTNVSDPKKRPRVFFPRPPAAAAAAAQKASTSSPVSASRRQRRPQNVDGDFFVDHTCIDCDTCRWMAPQVFARVGDMSAVFKQPSSKEERLKALQALLSCPSSSIRTEKPGKDILEAQKTFPIQINEQRIPGVYHCGYHSDKSYGAASYLIIRPEGNILVDSPRYTERLASNMETMGGVRYMFLTHKDDVADHEKWSKRFRCDRILHSKDVEFSTADVEIKLEGNGPWNLGCDIDLVYTPGHSEGSVCLFNKPLKTLFTGAHLSMNETGLSIFERYNWFSVPMQLKSVRLLLELDFEWILPGHGRRAEFRDYEDKNSVLEAFLDAKLTQDY
ncbi:uncharacterized protein LOC131324839 isoform X1 [Rhododendron vialii]|uniref:uncharacterized protein LOC131324839 isoform X1 n=1 Tax=Rhododendron vialii TaxID=182163 RepID=UPI00265F596B|nr:uncharacterized protein LOC131324839 isoform X1 [Rhododendron vialii]XP_058212971.1 uncharacterized protein LOC131324839 isoform X1 [Rhododendron vialii]